MAGGLLDEMQLVALLAEVVPQGQANAKVLTAADYAAFEVRPWRQRAPPPGLQFHGSSTCVRRAAGWDPQADQSGRDVMAPQSSMDRLHPQGSKCKGSAISGVCLDTTDIISNHKMG